MGCTNCIHNFVCTILQNSGYQQDCKCFIDKECIIELPCKLGEMIYAIVEKKKGNKEEKYRYIQSYYLTYSNIERVIKNFGKTIFLTQEDAEMALSKMNAVVAIEGNYDL